MIIAVLSDIHDHVWNLRKAIQIIKEHGCKGVIFCGDLCSPFTAGILAELALPTYACFGNNDEDHLAISKKLNAVFLAPLTDEFAEVTLNDKKIAFCHYPKLGELLAVSGNYDAVFHGHTHISYQKNLDKTLLANPGAVCGIQNGSAGVASIGMYDTLMGQFSHVNI